MYDSMQEPEKRRKNAETHHPVHHREAILYLKINLEKTTVNHISKVKYLGYGFYRYKGKCRMRVHPKSVRKMKNRLRELTVRGNKWSNPVREEKLRKYTDGWINYYRLADMKSLMETTDEQNGSAIESGQCTGSSGRGCGRDIKYSEGFIYQSGKCTNWRTAERGHGERPVC